MPDITLNVNGDSKTLKDIDPEMPLLWALRDELNLVGTKFGCGIAQCGACTVHFEGNPVRSCALPVSAVAGKNITTIEGLVKDDQLNVLQQAWVEMDVPQCGYCQAGQLMSATALLEKNSNPSDEDIDTAMAGNICRCGTYVRVRAAIKKAAAAKRGDTV